jgi:trehalose 6-phosphate synthase
VSRLVVISNRVAVPDPAGKIKPGGLAVAVNAALKNRSGLWFGWSGKTVDEPSDRPVLIVKDRVTYGVVDLTDADLQEYYNGFANRVLWPILHYRVDLAEFQRADLSGYIRVNEMFADRVSKILEPDDVVWIHDYHMMPLARYLRDRGHQNRIGFFLHIPMPPPDILQTLPRHGEIIGALADYDLVGFQTENDRDNFARYLSEQGGSASRDGTTYSIRGRSVRIGAFPVSIATASFARSARRAERSTFMQEVKDSLAARKLVIGVDRLDYSKGIGDRLDAFERFLSDHPEWRGHVTFLQITPKSRSDIPEYAEMDREVSSKAGQINGTYGEATWTPIRYVNRTYSRTALSGLYRAANVALVTPLRDGMNLVAKEYVAAQNPDNPGVLILSKFAGAVAELSEGALVVNPHETEGVSAAIRRALDMPLDERKARFAPMMRVITANDIDHWAQSFLDALAETQQRAGIVDNIRALFAQ